MKFINTHSSTEFQSDIVIGAMICYNAGVTVYCSLAEQFLSITLNYSRSYLLNSYLLINAVQQLLWKFYVTVRGIGHSFAARHFHSHVAVDHINPPRHPR